MTIYSGDYPERRLELFKKVLCEEKQRTAQENLSIVKTVGYHELRIKPGAIRLFNMKATKERLARLLFRNQNQSETPHTYDRTS